MQTVLGAGGAAGTEAAKALRRFTREVRLVSRNPKAVHPDDALFPADLKKPKEVSAAVQGPEVAYLTAGRPYSTRVWWAQWPKIIENVLSACEEHGTRLVFLDNVYLYDPDHLGHMTGEAPNRPVSRKGEVRKAVGERVLQAIAKGMGVAPEYKILSKTMLNILGIFVPVMGETAEMLYQYERDYVFDSGTFESRFHFKPTPPEEGIRGIVREDYRKERGGQVYPATVLSEPPALSPDRSPQAALPENIPELQFFPG